jgi:hypothetical protein
MYYPAHQEEGGSDMMPAVAKTSMAAIFPDDVCRFEQVGML